jgi:hypothetical protein
MKFQKYFKMKILACFRASPGWKHVFRLIQSF